MAAGRARPVGKVNTGTDLVVSNGIQWFTPN